MPLLVLLIARLVSRHNLTPRQAIQALTQRWRGDKGPHVHCVNAEIHSILCDTNAPYHVTRGAMRIHARPSA
ncbi:hypothetical protein [Embleya sp. NPDC001921]